MASIYVPSKNWYYGIIAEKAIETARAAIFKEEDAKCFAPLKKLTCTCKSRDLFDFGCKCGYLSQGNE